MKRLLGAAALAALALVLVLSGGGDVGPARAASTKCVWIKHTKRVVRHVKRHGKVHRVARIKHYRSCRKVAVPETAPTPTTTPTPGPTAPSEGVPPATTPEPQANAVGITADDHTTPYTYRPSHSTVKAGELTVQLINVGEDEHNMDMQKVGPDNSPGPIVVAVSAASKGASTPTTVDVEPGTYRMWCTLPGHAAKGMETTITVE